ncbi:MAG: SpoIID/LytB domain-containing protein [Clostridium sp.]|nr:SpoIID/LytB domain-containing protein [Clostridium sp.]
MTANNGKIVKVGISNQNFSNYYFNTISVSATDNFRLIDKSQNSVIADFGAGESVKIDIKNNLFTITSEGTEISSGVTGPVAVESDNGFVTVTNLKRAGKPAYYRGTFEITKVPKKDNQFNVINVLDLESYLRGVVPNEMPVRFGLEALKAQTVTARNYVLRPREKNYHNFDVCDSVACQVYYGANTEKELSDRAVIETENLVALYNDELILALYSSTAGGYTESYENAFSTDLPNGTRIFPGAPKPFLKAVPDNDKIPVLSSEDEARKFYTSVPETFDNASPYFRWTKEWDQKELEDVLKKTLKTQSKTGFVKPKFENPEDFGKLKDIKVTKRGLSGKAMSVDIVTDRGTFTVQKELPIRRTFQKNNISLPSANVVFDIVTIKPDTADKKAKPTKRFLARGGGFGHGVGMSQYGAGEMNKRGYSYGEILQHYYKNISIATYPVILSNQNGHDTDSQVFYTKDKTASLIIENKFQFSKFIIVINGQELRLEMAPHLFKSGKFDLSPYIVEGRNRITYMLPYSELHKKPVKLYVEIKEAKND